MKLNAAKVVTARHQKGMNQTELARKCGLTVVTISKAENGGDVYPATGKRICRALGIELSEVVLPTEDDGDAA